MMKTKQLYKILDELIPIVVDDLIDQQLPLGWYSKVFCRYGVHLRFLNDFLQEFVKDAITIEYNSRENSQLEKQFRFPIVVFPNSIGEAPLTLFSVYPDNPSLN